MYPIDPELAAHLGQLEPTDFSDIPAARRQMAKTAARTGRALADPGPKVVALTIPGPADRPEVAVRVYTPAGPATVRGALLYLHGGGFALGDLDFSDATCRGYATDADLVVVAVDYRLAPEHPFPAGLDDGLAALTWLADEHVGLGVDPDRIGVAGESAGAGLAAALSLLARDRRGPRIRFQLLEIPVLDDTLHSPSMLSYTDTPVWDRHNAQLSWELYLGPDLTPGDPQVAPYAAPARATDLTGLPAAHVVTAEFDPLRDEGIAYAQRLMSAGVGASLVCYAGTFHGSTMFAEAEVSRRMWRDTVEALRRGLSERVAATSSPTGQVA
jgi:acetyl esterase/lipase